MQTLDDGKTTSNEDILRARILLICDTVWDACSISTELVDHLHDKFGGSMTRLSVGMGQISEIRDGVIHEPLGIKKISTMSLLKCLNADQKLY